MPTVSNEVVEEVGTDIESEDLKNLLIGTIPAITGCGFPIRASCYVDL